jgi:hypothetical protein
MDLATVLICSVCGKNLFKEKNHDGTILLHCENCGSSCKVAKAGIGFAVVSSLQESGRVFPVAKEVKEKKNAAEDTDGESKIFQVIEFRVPSPVKSLIQAALLCAKEAMGLSGSYYAGTVLGNILSDYLSGFDYTTLSPKTLEKVTALLQGVANDIQNEAMVEELKALPGGTGDQATAAIQKVVDGPFAGLPKHLADVKATVEEQKKDAKHAHAQKVGQIRRKKSFGRLETCVRALDSRIQHVRGSDEAVEATELDGLYSMLEAGTTFLAQVKDGSASLSDTAVQRYMKGVEKSMGLPPPTKRTAQDNDGMDEDTDE